MFRRSKKCNCQTKEIAPADNSKYVYIENGLLHGWTLAKVLAEDNGCYVVQFFETISDTNGVRSYPVRRRVLKKNTVEQLA